ncbi:MAG TPA: zinc-binding dehydrogenase [Planctomycetota bacterium]|nr:zinc-binding dehydrogenase [Planctomycetota bacterium]HRR82588.1 zinc-binding dehydrogenase [Planctomycetota bacterium]HRT95054.1 zinc-binding dehydrogenase [Planctomycetota bacterium]
MKALQMVAPRTLALRDDVVAPAPRQGEVLVRCAWVSVCGSNIHPFLGLGRWAGDYPKPPGWDGHECVGTVVESRLPGWEPGTLVLAHPEDYLGFAELVRAKPPGLVRLPKCEDPVPFITAQPLATVLRAMSRIQSVANQRCAVVGQGPMGLIFTRVLRHAGARQVIGIDLLENRLEAARRFGATDVVDAAKANVPEAVRALTGGAMVDLSVEAVGLPESLATATLLPRRKGRVYVFGVARHATQDFPLNHFMRNEMEMVSSVGPECVEFFESAVRMVADGEIDLSALITHRLPWAEAQRAFEMYADHANGALKVVLEV